MHQVRFSPWAVEGGRLFLVAAIATLSACGAPPAPPPAVPPPANAPAAPPASAEAPAAEAAPPAPAVDAPAPAAAPADTAPAPAESKVSGSQKPIEVITAREAAFLIDYANSAPKQTAQARCEKEAKDDADKLAACLTKARDQFLPDVLRFRRDSEQRISLVVYKRNGSSLSELSVGSVQLTEEGNDGVRIKFVTQKGARPVWRGRPEALISVPNGYTIEFDEPVLGHLRYDAKVGLVSE